MDVVEVQCEQCDRTAQVSVNALRSFGHLVFELPDDWYVDLAGRDSSGAQVLRVYCPAHHPLHSSV